MLMYRHTMEGGDGDGVRCSAVLSLGCVSCENSCRNKEKRRDDDDDDDGDIDDDDNDDELL